MTNQNSYNNYKANWEILKIKMNKTLLLRINRQNNQNKKKIKIKIKMKKIKKILINYKNRIII